MRKACFPAINVLVSTVHGPMIVSRYDYHQIPDGRVYGVGYELLQNAGYQPEELLTLTQLVGLRRQYFGDGVQVLDCGANIGTHTVTLAQKMFGWGEIQGFEAQERVFYMLAGNLALNNCHNARVRHVAVGSFEGVMWIPVLDPLKPCSFGSLELGRLATPEEIGQPVSYDDMMEKVKIITIDSLHMERVDLIKIDVEGMELEVLSGAAETIARCKPILVIERIKVDETLLAERLSDYTCFASGLNVIAVHPTDPISQLVRME